MIRYRDSGWMLVLIGWLVAVCLSSTLIAIRATHIQTMDRLMPFLIIPVWIVSGALLFGGTFRVLCFVNNRVLRLIITVLVVSLQVFGYLCLLMVGSVYVHIWAGGNL